MVIDKNMNKHDLAEKSGVSSASIAKLSKGANITTDVLLKICESLDCALEDIMETVKDWRWGDIVPNVVTLDMNTPSVQYLWEKDNCMDNGAMENFFGRLKVEMFYGEKFETVDEFINCLKEYIFYYNNERIVAKLKMRPVQYRTHSLAS